MVERLCQHPDRANRDCLALRSLHHHWFLRHAIDREDGDLRRIDNWSSQKRAKATGVRERVGCFGQVVRTKQARASLLDQRVDSRASSGRDFWSASLTTGTIKPSGPKSTAMPRLTRGCNMSESASSVAFTAGKSATASQTARATKGK